MTIERPIIFSAPMVRAILAGTKTQTRRAVKGSPVAMVQFIDAANVATGIYGFCATHERVINRHMRCPYGVTGDRLWVRETWQAINGDDRAAHIIVDPRPNADWIEYAATPRKNMAPPPRYRSPIHMPRWASRITLEITQICVERLQNMTVGDCIAEGVGRYDPDHAFMNLWESIYGPGSWSANPWVWAITFRAIAACA